MNALESFTTTNTHIHTKDDTNKPLELKFEKE